VLRLMRGLSSGEVLLSAVAVCSETSVSAMVIYTQYKRLFKNECRGNAR